MNSTHPAALTQRVVTHGIESTVVDTRTQGSPMLLLHGIGGSTESHFAHLLPMLAARHRVVSIDFGMPPTDTDLTVGILREQVVSALRTCDLAEPVTMMGYSLGAVVAAEVAAHHPEHIRRLILLNGWIKTTRQQSIRQKLFGALQADAPDALRDLLLYTLLSPTYLQARTDAELDALGNALAIAASTDLSKRLSVLADDVDLSNTVLRITTPTLVIGCTNDLVTPVAQAEALYGAIENSRLTFIDSGHNVLIERPAQVFSLVDAFATDRASMPAGAIISSPAV